MELERAAADRLIPKSCDEQKPGWFCQFGGVGRDACFGIEPGVEAGASGKRHLDSLGHGAVELPDWFGVAHSSDPSQPVLLWREAPDASSKFSKDLDTERRRARLTCVALGKTPVYGDDQASERPPPFADAESFAEILPEHDDYLRGVVWAVVRDPDVIDDIMQATYEKAYRSVGGFDGRSSLRTWLHTICYRTAIDHIRHELRQHRVSLDVAATEAIDPRQRSMSDDVDKRLVAIDVLARLDPEHRALLYFTAGLGYSYDEVAEIVGMSRGTVASKVSRAKDRLRKGVRYE